MVKSNVRFIFSLSIDFLEKLGSQSLSNAENDCRTAYAVDEDARNYCLEGVSNSRRYLSQQVDTLKKSLGPNVLSGEQLKSILEA